MNRETIIEALDELVSEHNGYSGSSWEHRIKRLEVLALATHLPQCCGQTVMPNMGRLVCQFCLREH